MMFPLMTASKQSPGCVDLISIIINFIISVCLMHAVNSETEPGILMKKGTHSFRAWFKV